MSRFPTVALPLALLLIASSHAASADSQRYLAPLAAKAPVVDGVADDPAWERPEWQPVNHRWLGPEYSAEDFSGRYKATWTAERLYILFEFVDDVLIDAYADPLVQYWDDDTLEVFIDEDRSGGNHQYNHNAFAYHFSLDNRAIDIGTDRKAREYTAHTESRWQRSDDKVIWEVSIELYPDSYVDDGPDNRPLTLKSGKVMGFMLAYCDNDGSEIRENFIGSVNIDGPGKDRGWIDAGAFGELELVK